jgi:hypothetical protein
MLASPSIVPATIPLGDPAQRPRFTLPLPSPPLRLIFCLDDRMVPFPKALGPLLRTDHPDVHYALVLRTVFGRRHRPWDGPASTDPLDRLRRLLERNCTHPDIAPLVRDLVPIAACEWCGQPFLRENLRRMFCCDRHRRKWATAGRVARAARPTPRKGAMG